MELQGREVWVRKGLWELGWMAESVYLALAAAGGEGF
jgi:hypothetical protein